MSPVLPGNDIKREGRVDALEEWVSLYPKMRYRAAKPGDLVPLKARKRNI